jgi:hypothetical protein
MTAGTSLPRKRRAVGRLNRLVKGQSPATGKLPLVHITRAYAFDEMLDAHGLDPQYCDVFRENLVYLFYGRPAYRAKEGNNARLEFEWPIVFIFDPDKMTNIKRLFSFDTGAFKLKFYEDFFDNKSELLDFELEPTLETARKLVSAFYVDHKEYYHGASRKNVALGHREFEAQGIFELARLPGVQGTKSLHRVRDERSSAIELQIDATINFRDSLLAVILPEPYLDDDEIKDALVRWEVKEIETYATLHNLSGEAWVGQIYEITRKLYGKLGYLP